MEVAKVSLTRTKAGSDEERPVLQCATNGEDLFCSSSYVNIQKPRGVLKVSPSPAGLMACRPQ